MAPILPDSIQHDQLLILSYSYDVNSHSGVIGEEFINAHPLSNEIETLSVDGAYFRQSTVEIAKEKNIEMNFSQLIGRSVKED